MLIRLRLTLAALASSLVWLTPLTLYTQTPPALAQTRPDLTEAERLNQQVNELFQKGRYAEAVPLAEQVLAIREKILGPNHPDVAQSLNDLAVLLNITQRQYAKAEPLLQRSLAIREKALGPDHPDVAESLDNLSFLYNGQEQYSKAEPLLQRSLAIREKALGSDHPDVVQSLNTLAWLYQVQGQYAKAEPLLQRILTIREKAPGSDYLDVAKSLDTLATLYYNQGQYAKAEPLYQRSLAIYEKARGSNDPSSATILNNLANLYLAQGEYSKAEPLFQRSLAIYEKALGSDHPNVAITLSNLASLYNSQGEYAKAETLFQRSLAIRKNALPSDHLNVTHNLEGLANLYQLQGQYAKAEPLYKRSLAIREKALGPEHPDVAQSLNNLAVLYNAQGQYTKAEPLFQRSLAIREKALGPEHPDVAHSLNGLAILYKSEGQYAKAEPLFQRSLAIREKALGPDHPDVANSLNNLAALYEDQEQYAKVEPLYQRSLAIIEKALGPDHTDVATILNNLASLYDTLRQYAKAEPLYQRSLAIYEKALGSDHPDVASILNNLAALYEVQGQYAKAEPLFQRSLAIYEKALGSDHPDVASILNNLAALYAAQNDVKRAVAFLTRGLEVEETNLAQNIILGSEQDKRDYLATFSGTTDSAISLHLQTASNDPATAQLALTTILRRKGRILDVLGQSLSQIRQQLNSSLQQDLDELVDVRAQLAKVPYQQTLSVPEKEAELKTLMAKTQTLETKLSRSSLAFAQATQRVTLAAVQAAIPQDAALIEFIQYEPFNPKVKPGERFGQPRYAVYLLRAQGQPLWADLGTAAELDPLIKEFRFTIQDRRKQPKEVKSVAQKLDAKLMQPVRALLKTQPQQLLIAPDGQLNLMPFAALIDEQNRYLLETYQITYLTSGRDLIRQHDSAVKTQSPLILANPNYDLAENPKPKTLAARERGISERSGDFTTLTFGELPGTAQEATAIQPLLPNVELLTGSQATETALKQVSNPRTLHLATHGFFLNNQPPQKEALPGQPQRLTIENPLLRAGLALAGVNKRQSGGDDGVLTALEVAGLDLRATELVVLSACDTGKGEVVNGEGVYGLRRAFTLAGAHSLLMSLWKVDDIATKDLMIRYYQAITKSQGRGDALRQVQLDMLSGKLKDENDRSYQHPYYWSAFIPQGDWSPLPQR